MVLVGEERGGMKERNGKAEPGFLLEEVAVRWLFCKGQNEAEQELHAKKPRPTGSGRLTAKGRGGRGARSNPLTGAGFSLGVMNSFWNWVQVVNVQHDECTTCCWIGLLCYVNVTSIFVLRYISKTNKQKKHPPQKKPQTQKRTSTSKELFCHATQKSCLSYKHADAAVLTRKERRQNKKH